ncbi:MAG TPA: DNA glycosylase [Chthoniobacterales bacterium]|nr:DNA glycosylase [Chthoniobacterales bacterium]
MEIPAPDFDLALTLDSGQTFHWEPAGAGFVGAIGARAVYVEQRGDSLFVRPGNAAQLCARYFALDHPLAEICAALPNDPAMRAAAAFCRGLRIMRQPRWECLATFITSSMKQVAHIRQISRTLRERFGEARSLGDMSVPIYPTAQRIAALDEETLRSCALGYRAKNLLATAQQIASRQVDLDVLASLSDDELRAALCALSGVGAKVANCVMLFAYERLRAFPIDVWVERVLREKYFPRRRKFQPNELEKFSAKYFGAHGGYAQQYLFHHARKTTPRRLSPRKR